MNRSKEPRLPKHTEGVAAKSQPRTGVNDGWLTLQGVNAVQEPLSKKAREDPGYCLSLPSRSGYYDKFMV